MKFKHLTLAMEAIEFQNGALLRELTSIVEPFIGNTHNTTVFTKLAAKIEACVETHTGVSLQIASWGMNRNMGIVSPLISNHHPFIEPYFGYTSSVVGTKLVTKSSSLVKGSVDLKKSKVSGVFKDLRPAMIIGLGELDGYMTAEEFSAIVLHELGHWFSYLETLSKTVTTNLILMGLDQSLRSTKTVKEREVILKSAASALEIENRVQGVDAAGSDKAIVQLFVTEAANELLSQSGSLFYDTNSWEMAADQFVARHGGARALASALDKGSHENGDISLRSKPMYYFMEIVKTVSAISAVVLGSAALVGPFAFYGVFFIFMGINTFASDGYSFASSQYDNPKDRLLRIRRQLIERSKSADLTKDQVKQLSEDVAVIDKLIPAYSEYASWFTHMSRFLFSGVRKKYEAAKVQKELEALALNDLFLTSVQLNAA